MQKERWVVLCVIGNDNEGVGVLAMSLEGMEKLIFINFGGNFDKHETVIKTCM